MSDLGVGKPVPPSQRPRKERSAARVVVMCDGRYLLGERYDPGMPDCRWWSTPGGGIDPGEDAATAAARELAEELGIDVDPADLRGPVARRVVVHGYTDQVTRQAEAYFVLEVERPFEPSSRFMTEREQVSSGPWRWFGADELGSVWVWDEVELLARLAQEPAAWVADLGEEEQSSVPAGASD